MTNQAEENLLKALKIIVADYENMIMVAKAGDVVEVTIGMFGRLARAKAMIAINDRAA